MNTAFTAAICVLATLSAHAQTTNTATGAVRIAPLRRTTTTVPAAALRNATAVVAPGEAPAGDGGTETNDFAGAVKKMKFDRTPEALSAAVRTQQGGGKLSEVEKFKLAVLLGNWTAVGTALKALPAADAMAAYTRLIESVGSNSQSASQFFQQQRNQPTVYDPEEDPSGAARPATTRTRRSLLLSDDVYGLMNAAPQDLGQAQLSGISTLVKLAIGPAGKQDFLARLARGLRGLGGDKADGRKLAAQLLSSVGWMSDAGPYLPLKREEWDGADTLSLVLALEYFTQTGVENKDERQLKRAAEVCAFMMQGSRFSANDRGLFRQATDRFIKLLPALEADDATQLIRENFLTEATILVDLILAVGEAGQAAQRGTDLGVRAQSLATQNLLLRVLEGRKGALPEAVNVLVMNWLGEAEQTYRSGGGGAQVVSDIDNPYIIYRPQYSVRQTVRSLAPEAVISRAPSAALTRRLNTGLAQRVNLTLLKVNLVNQKEAMSLDSLKTYLKEHPGQEKELCQEYLAAWVKKRTVPAEDPNIVRMRNLGYSIPKQQFSGIPLTRLRQNQNVVEFKSLLAALRPLTPEPIDPASVVQAFMAIHSGAEVYRIEDIETIFGPPEKMERAELMGLITGMRTKLREQWRDPGTQQEAGTNRTEQETKDEVSRGYRTALALVKRGLRPEDADWKQFIVRGQLFFDASEYEFARNIKLSDYVSLRDEAFGSYRKASEIYAAKLPAMARGQWTMEPYQMWFFVMLGASDLSQLTRAAARSDPGLKSIGDAMRALPGEAADTHLTKFGQMLGDVLSQVPANMKQKFLGAGLQVIGEDHPSAKAATESLNNYKELLDEVQLRLAVDGPTRVGHGQSFGAFLSLEHSKQLARESGGFSKYLQNPASQGRAMMMMATPGRGPNYRDDFTKNIHAALGETFEIASVTFHDATVKPIDLPREGWQETPLAYLVLRAKDAAVDRIPSVQLDMDFADTAGQVVLPVRSQVQPIDAKDPQSATPRPCEQLALAFTMDEREWRKEGKVVVEISAKGRGIIPSHTQMFDFAREGFDVEVTDNGLTVVQFTSDGRAKTAQADRSWQFTYRRKKDLRGDAVLKFPALRAGIPVSTNEFKHYQDADLVQLDAKDALTGVTLRSGTSSALRTGVIAAVILAAVGGAFWLLGRKQKSNATVETGLELPAHITPFSVVAFLRRVLREHGARLDDSTRQSLQAQIREIESAFFSGGTAGSAVDLSAVAREWLEVVR